MVSADQEEEFWTERLQDRPFNSATFDRKVDVGQLRCRGQRMHSYVSGTRVLVHGPHAVPPRRRSARVPAGRTGGRVTLRPQPRAEPCWRSSEPVEVFRLPRHKTQLVDTMVLSNEPRSIIPYSDSRRVRIGAECLRARFDFSRGLAYGSASDRLRARGLFESFATGSAQPGSRA